MTNPIEKIKGVPDECAIIAIASTELGYKAYAMSNIKDYKNVATMAVCRAVMELLDQEGLELYEKGMELLMAELKARGVNPMDMNDLTYDEYTDLMRLTPAGNA